MDIYVLLHVTYILLLYAWHKCELKNKIMKSNQKNCLINVIISWMFQHVLSAIRASGGAVGCGTESQDWRSRVRYSIGSSDILTWPSPHSVIFGVHSAPNRNGYQRISFGRKLREARRADKSTILDESNVEGRVEAQYSISSLSFHALLRKGSTFTLTFCQKVHVNTLQYKGNVEFYSFPQTQWHHWIRLMGRADYTCHAVH